MTRIFIDTNVLVSAVLSSGTCAAAIDKIIRKPGSGVISYQTLEELIGTFDKKFPSRRLDLNVFLSEIFSYMEIIPTPEDTSDKESIIRDKDDRLILRAAIVANVDAILTGDKDFLESGIESPCILSPTDFLGWEDLLEGKETMHMVLYEFVKTK